MNQVEGMRQQIKAMQADLAEAAAARRRSAVAIELSRQAPNAPDVVRRLAVAELGSTEDVAGEVKRFLVSESISGLIGQKQQVKQTQEVSQGKRPKLSEMLGEVQSGDAKLSMGR